MRLIDADALEKRVRKWLGGHIAEMELFLTLIDDEETVKSKWIPVPPTNGRGGHECEKCHSYAPSYKNGDEYLSDYCPSCGASMK